MRKGRAGSTRPTTTCWPPRPGSRASSASPRGTCPSSTGSGWAAPSPASTARPLSSRGAGRTSEYLMPLLVMRSYPGTLLEETCLGAVRRQQDYGSARGVPGGVSESAYDLIDRHDNYQYKAFGVPGLGLKRGLGDQLVGGALRHGARRARRSRPGGPEPPAPEGRRARRRPRLLRVRRFHAAPRRRAWGPARGAQPLPGHDCAGVPGPPPGDDPDCHRQRAAGQPDGGAVSRRSAGPRPPSCPSRRRPRATRPSPARARTSRRRERPPCRPSRSVASARRTRRTRTPSSFRTATTPRW